MNLSRLACHGLVDEASGSVSTANYLLVRELTGRGISADLFANLRHVPPPEGMPKGRFTYRGFEPPLLDRWLDSLPRAAAFGGHRLLLPAVDAAWRRTYQPPAESTQGEDPYDALLGLGMIPPFQVKGIPTVTWLQGPLSTELEAIRRLRSQIVAARGRLFYAALVAGYRYSVPLNRRRLRSSARVIVGSDWSRRALIRDRFEGSSVHALPYPIDLELFRPANEGSEIDWEAPTIVSLGRLDPRKRLDLLLEAFRLVLLEHPGATLRIAGRQGYTPQLPLIERFPARDRVRYQPEIPRWEVPELLREAALLVQVSENENFGSSVAEALACGTPVVVGSSNGTGEYVDEASQRFDSYTPEAAAEAIIAALRTRKEDPEGVRLSTRAAAERSFEVSKIADRLVEIIEAARSSLRP
jgi:glycosyltransferase involved in cell wall biosynthesis